MDEEIVDYTVLSVSMVAALLGVAVAVDSFVQALGPLIVAVVGFAYVAGGFDSLLARVGPSDAETDPAEDALTELRQRYARGDLDRAEFERRLDDLLATETVEEARDHRVRRRPDESAGGDPREADGDPEPAREQ